MILILVALIAGCDKDSSSTINMEVPERIALVALVHFDTSESIIARSPSPEGWAVEEWYVYGERVIGEPFVDVNGDGEYQPHCDIFWIGISGTEYIDTFYFQCDSFVGSTCYNPIRTPDPASGFDWLLVDTFSNHDLNYNGKYDGPDSAWSPGVPFDDLDGDGEYDAEFGGYVPGLPYADLNGNGSYDSYVEFQHGIYRYQVERYGPSNELLDVQLRFLGGDSTYVYLSDSGILHDSFTSHGDLTDIRPAPPLNFRLDDDGLWWTASSISGTIPLLLLQGPEIYAEQPRDTILESIYGSYYGQKREILVNQSLTIDGEVYRDLVCVRILRVWLVGIPDMETSVTASFYFAPNTLHLLACHSSTFEQDTSYWYFLDRRVDTLPLPATR
jgi:hypothetical protein